MYTFFKENQTSFFKPNEFIASKNATSSSANWLAPSILCIVHTRQPALTLSLFISGPLAAAAARFVESFVIYTSLAFEAHRLSCLIVNTHSSNARRSRRTPPEFKLNRNERINLTEAD